MLVYQRVTVPFEDGVYLPPIFLLGNLGWWPTLTGGWRIQPEEKHLKLVLCQVIYGNPIYYGKVWYDYYDYYGMFTVVVIKIHGN